MSLISDLKQILINHKITEDIFLAYMGDEQDNLISLYQTGGYNRPSLHTTEPTFQVKIRNTDYENGYKVAKDIKDLLQQVTSVLIEGSLYLSFHQQGDIMELGRDSKDRMLFSLNFRTYVTENVDSIPNIPNGDCSEAIAELQLQIEELENDKANLQEQIDSMTIDNTELEAESQSLIEQVLFKDERITELGLQIIHLEEGLLIKDTLITKLELDIDTKAIRITQLEEDNSIKVIKIIELNSNIEGLTLQVATKDAEIDTLNLTILNRDVIIENLEIDITSKNLIIEELTGQNEGKDIVISSLQVDIEAKRLEIATLNNTIIEKDELISEQIEEIETKDILIADKDAKIIEKDGIIETRDSTILSLEQEVITKQGQISQLELDLASNIIELEDAQVQITTLQAEIVILQDRITDLEEGEPGTEPTGQGRIFIDLGSDDYLTEALNWNNLTNHIDGSIDDLIDENLNPTGIKVTVTKEFNSIVINNYNEDFTDYYYHNVIKDGFYNDRRNGTIGISNLSPDKYYRITLFASGNTGGAATGTVQIATNDVQYTATNESVLNIPFFNNKGKTVARTLKPTTSGVIFILMRNGIGDRCSLNSIEIEEMKTFI